MALVRVWGAVQGTLATLAEHEEVVRLRDDLFAVLAAPGDPAVFDLAIREVERWLADLSAVGGRPPGVLILPGVVRSREGLLEPDRERFLEDLEKRPPDLPLGEVTISSRVATRLEIARRLGRRRLLTGPSELRVPVFPVGHEDLTAPPWRSPTLFRRQLPWSPRVELEAALGALDDVEAFRVTGALGSGKSRAVWEALGADRTAAVWVTARPARHRGPSLASQLAFRIASGVCGEEPARRARETFEALGVRRLAQLTSPGGEPPDLADPEAVAGWLREWLAGVGNGRPPVVVCDAVEVAGQQDLALIEALVAGALARTGPRVVVIGRGAPLAAGGRSLRGLPEVVVPKMEPSEAKAFTAAAGRGLDLPEAVAQTLLEHAAGNPFAFEEGLAALAEQDRIRELHGSLFFRQGDELASAPSQRLVRHVEAEVWRLGTEAPLRFLAIAGEAAPDEGLSAAALTAGTEVDPAWAVPVLEARLIEEGEGPWGPGVAFSCPAHAQALRSVLPEARVRELRRMLGTSLAVGGESGAWRTFRMLEGSGAAIEPLLAAVRERAAPPQELLAALDTELARQRASGIEPAVELEILWGFLPLARDLGELAGHREDLDRAVVLAADDPRKRVALAGLLAEVEEAAGRLDEAEAALRSALEDSRKAGGEAAQAVLLLRVARLMVRRERLTDARQLLEKLLPVLEKAKAEPLAATARFHLANIAVQEGRLDEAFGLHRQALSARRRAGKPEAVGVSLSALGAATLRMGRYAEALAFYREAEDVFTSVGDDDQASFALLGIGRALGRLGDFTGSAGPLRKALALKERTASRVGIAVARLEVSKNHLLLGNPQAALEEARRSHFDFTWSSATAPLAEAEQVLGRIFLVRRDLEGARRHLKIALETHRRLHDHEQAAFDLSFLLLAELQVGETYEVSRLVAELQETLDHSPPAERGEILAIRLYRGLENLERQLDGAPYLRRAYEGLMQKTSHLPVELRHRFLFQIQEHQEIIEAATVAGLVK